MNATAAIAMSLLAGRVLTIKTGYRDFGVSNLPREMGRSIERKFGVILSRVVRHGETKYGVPVHWTEYRLPVTEYNKEGMKKMREYINAQESIKRKRKNKAIDFKQSDQINLF